MHQRHCYSTLWWYSLQWFIGLSFFLFSLSCKLLVHKYPSSELSREAMGMVLHKDSKWYQQWKDFKDNNVVFNSKCSKDKVVAHYFLWSDSCHVGPDAIYATSLNITQIMTLLLLLWGGVIRRSAMLSTACLFQAAPFVCTSLPQSDIVFGQSQFPVGAFTIGQRILDRSTFTLLRGQGRHKCMSPGIGLASCPWAYGEEKSCF